MTSTRTRRRWAAGLAVAAAMTMGATTPGLAQPGSAQSADQGISTEHDERLRTPRPPAPPPGPGRPAPEAPPAPRDALPAGFSTWEELFDEQRRLNQLADRILAAGRDGFAGAVVDPTNHDVRLHWKGALPAAVAAAVDAARLQAPVQVFPAAHTEAELEVEAQRWLDSGFVTDAYGKADGSGVAIEVAGSSAAGPPSLSDGARTAFSVTYDAQPFAPLADEATDEATDAGTDAGVASPFPVSRQFDISPYWGGARLKSPTGSCTTGFSVTDSEGYASMLTVGHCGEPGHEITTGWHADKIGQLWWDWDYQDIALVWVYSDSQGWVYSGPWNSTYGLRIKGVQHNYEGNYVCTSGATSGEHCSVKVYDVSPSDVTVRARNGNSGCAAAHGDSGGPVVTRSGVDGAYGKGLISAGSSGVTCWAGSTPIGGYNKVMYKSLTFALGYFGATLRTA